MIQKLLDNNKLRNCNLKSNESIFMEIRNDLEAQIEILYKLDDLSIKNELVRVYGEVEDEKFEIHLNNLLYIKQCYFLEKKEIDIDIKDSNIDFESFKEITLGELLENQEFRDVKGKSIEIELKKIKNIVNKKNEEIDKWKDYNVASTIAKKWGISEESIRIISSLDEYIKFTSEMKNGTNFVSRGQKDCTYKLAPSLYRKYKSDYGIHANYYESTFKQKIIYYDKDLKSKTEVELRAEGQHFGLPTEYLDFTEAHLISLLFAIEDYEYMKQHSIVYFIDSFNYNKDNVQTSEKLIDYSDENTIKAMDKYSSRSFFIKLGNLNERIHFQKGCFLKVSPEEKLEEKLKKYCKIVIINKECKKDILKELFNLGITFENIYPDKDNVVKSIKFHYEEMIGGEKNE